MDGSFGLGYRSDRELRDWMAKDPIRRFRQFLVSEKLLTDEQAEQIVADTAKAVDEAATWAASQPPPAPEDGLRNVFAEGSVPLHTT